MAAINYFLVSLESQFFPLDLVQNDNLRKEVPALNFSNGEELYVDLLHPVSTDYKNLIAWNERVGPVILVSRIPVSPESSDHLKSNNFELIHIGDIARRIKDRDLLATSNTSALMVRPRPPAHGEFEEVLWGELLVGLYANRMTGQLYVKQDKRKKVIEFYKGIPCNIKSNKGQELLGRMLVDEGIIKLDQCEESVTKMHAQKVLQGEVLMEMGLLTEGQLKAALDRQWAIKLIDLFEWSSGEFTFKEGEVEPPTSQIPFPMWEVVFNGLVFISKAMIDGSLARSAELYPVPNPIPALRYQPLPMSIDFSAFQQIDGRTPVSVFIENASDEIKKVLVALLLSDVLILSTKPMEVPFSFGGIPLPDEPRASNIEILQNIENEMDNTEDPGIAETWLRKLHPDRFLHEEEAVAKRSKELFAKLLERKPFPAFSARNIRPFRLGWKNRDDL